MRPEPEGAAHSLLSTSLRGPSPLAMSSGVLTGSMRGSHESGRPGRNGGGQALESCFLFLCFCFFLFLFLFCFFFFLHPPPHPANHHTPRPPPRPPPPPPTHPRCPCKGKGFAAA